MANTIVGLRFPGDAVVSYGALKRAGEVQAKSASLPAVLTLFAIVEAIVLYERLWYAPFGDAGLGSVSSLPAWMMLQSQALIAPIDAALVADDAHAARSARESWRRQVRALGEVPAYEHISPDQLLENTFHHALNAQIWAYDAASESVDVMTADGLALWQRHVAGIGFDARAEAANDGNDDGRFTDWETTSVYLAREEFAPFRARYRGFAETLRNPAGLSLGDLLAAKREAMQEVGAALNKVKAQRTDTRVISEVIGASVKPGEGDDDDLLEIKPTLSLTGLVKIGVEKAALKHIKGRAQILFDSYAKAMSIRNYHSLVGGRLGVALTREDDAAYQAYAQAAERFARVERATE